MAKSPFSRVQIKDMNVTDAVQVKSVDILRMPAPLAIVNIDVDGRSEGLRFDYSKKVFLDSLGNKHLDEALDKNTGDLAGRIGAASRKRGRSGAVGYHVRQAEGPLAPHRLEFK